MKKYDAGEKSDLLKKTILLLLCLLSVSSYSMETLFYTDDNLSDYSLTSYKILNRVKQAGNAIDIIAPQVYQLSANGLIWGSVDSNLLKYAKTTQLKVMPLIINANFDQKNLRQFLNNDKAQQRAIKEILALCEKYHFYGIQFDFENININDKEAYTHFFKETATLLHKNGFVISATIVPIVENAPLFTAYNEWYKANWSGAYDVQKLGKLADFITLMTYDRHTSYTTPGPVAPYHWVKNVLTSVLKVVSANKISLGIPAYSGLWRTGKLGDHFQAKENQISYEQAMQLVKKEKVNVVWDNQSQSDTAIFSHNYLNEYLFIENAKSFKAKLALVSQYHLRGISVWQLGSEDPAIWKMLKKSE